MPDELCRNCGGKLRVNSTCPHCFKPNGMICQECAYCTTEQFHSICMSQLTNQTNAVPKVKSGNYSMVVAVA